MLQNKNFETRLNWTSPIANWAVWDGAQATSAPDLGFIDPMLRRRLSPLARVALHLARQCAGELPAVRFVYASRHGELLRTMELLEALATDSPLSPTTFGLSVLNTCPGLYSIARNDHSPATAIAAGEQSFAYGLLEAHCRAADGSETPVLYVYADAPLPAALPALTGEPETILAIALLLDPKAEKQLVCQQFTTATTREQSSQALAFLPCLGPLQQAEWSDGENRWHWQLQ